jgi:hypothetical protein
MHSIQVGGQIGPFVDPATGQSVPCRFFCSVTFTAQGDPTALASLLQSRVVMAANNVIGQKLSSGQVALPTLQQSVPYYVDEIIAAAGTAQMGIQIMQLQITGFEVLMPAPPAAPPVAMPPTPMQSAANAFGQAAANELDPRNKEYEARLNVGGFKIKASTDGGLDTAGLKNQVVDKAKSTVIWYAAGCLIVGLVVLGLAGLGGYIWYSASSSSSPASGPAKAAKWDGKGEFSCSGSDNLKLEGVTANLSSGTAIRASANCKLTLVNCNITAPTGIEAAANAEVEVSGGSVNSTQFSAKALGTSKVTFKGTKVTGKTQALGGAKITGVN